jgi:putative membrane protein
MHGYGWGWSLGGMWLSGVVLIAVLAVVIWWVAGMGRRSARAPQDPAEEALRLRYARGEIDHDEYERRLHNLRK